MSLQDRCYCVVCTNINEEIDMEKLDWESNKEAIGCFVRNDGMEKLYVKTKEWSDYSSKLATGGWFGVSVNNHSM